MQIQERWLEYDLSSLNYFLRETITSKIYKTFEKNVFKVSHTVHIQEYTGFTIIIR